MPNRDPKIDWQIAASDAEWEQLRGESDQAQRNDRPRWGLPPSSWMISLLVVMLVTGWAWRNHTEDFRLEPPATPRPHPHRCFAHCPANSCPASLRLLE
jgi:hypothetical protein